MTDIFIIGAGPQLARTDPGLLARIIGQPSIGLNMTQYAITPTIFLTAYATSAVMARMRVSVSTEVIYFGGPQGPLEQLSITRLPKKPIPADRLKDQHHVESIHTTCNAAIAATYLARSMGPDRIVYVGVEQNTSEYYYDYNDRVRMWALRDLAVIDSLFGLKNLDTHHNRNRGSVGRRLAQRISHPPNVTGQYSPRNVEKGLTIVMDRARREGIQCVSTLPDTIVTRCGGDYIPLQEVLTC